MKKSFKFIIAGLVMCTVTSCGYILRAIVTPNSCKKCEILDGGSIILTKDECGGGVHNMETKMKAKAYDMGPSYVVECESYKSE